MIKKWTLRRSVLMTLAVLLIAAATSVLLLPPEAEAIGCGDGSHGGTREWVASTAAARASTDAGECGSDARCEEWCFVACGDAVPLGVFRCTPIN